MGSRNRRTNAFKLRNPKFDVVHLVPHMNLGIECAADVQRKKEERERERAQSRAALAMSRAEKAGSINAKKRLV